MQTDAYIGSDGYARGLATALWSAVTEATDNTAIEISNYAVEWKLHKDGAPWHSAGTTDKTQLGFGGLDCGTRIEVRVRAVPTYSDKLGEWSEVFVATVESDTTPCSVPSKPIVSSKLGVVTIHWDGKTSTGAQMEPDFDHIEVGKGATAAGMQVISATQAGQGDYVITGLAIGSQHSYALRSVDHAGNRSAWSAIASVTVASAVPQETLDSINKDIAKAEAEAKAAKTTADGKNKVFTQAVEPAHSGLTNGDLWQKLDASGHISSVNIWNGSKFVAYSLVADSLLVPGSVNGSVLIKDGSVEAKNIKIGNGEILTELLKARKIVTDDVEAGQFKGYVFTGAVFQSSEAANTGVKLNSTALQMWDSGHNQTVYLDGEGKSNVLTGTFQTRTSGHRVRISPDYQSYSIGGTETFVGDGLEFPAYNGSTAFYSCPAIASVIQSNQVGAMGELDLWSGRVSKNDPAAFMSLRSKPRKKGGTGSGVTSQVYLHADTNYDESDLSKKSSSWLTMHGVGGSGASAYLNVRSDSGSLCEVGVHSQGAKARAYCTASDANGEIGMVSDISAGYLYLGGYLGGITSRFTFQSTNWRIYQNATLTADFTVPQTTWSWTPAKFGRYYGVCNSDLNWGSIFMHVCNTGGAGSMQVMGYNAGSGTFKGDMYVNAFAWLVK